MYLPSGFISEEALFGTSPPSTQLAATLTVSSVDESCSYRGKIINFHLFLECCNNRSYGVYRMFIEPTRRGLSAIIYLGSVHALLAMNEHAKVGSKRSKSAAAKG